jgi:hypothetical protein
MEDWSYNELITKGPVEGQGVKKGRLKCQHYKNCNMHNSQVANLRRQFGGLSIEKDGLST